MEMAGDHVGVAHGHGDRLVTEDRLQGSNIAGRLKERRCEMVPQVMASERHTGSAGDPDEAVGEGRVTLAVMVPEHVGRCDVPRCADKCADRHIAERHDPWAGGLGLGEPDLPTLNGYLRPFQPAHLLLTHAGFGKEADHPARHRGSLGHQPINLFGSRIGRPWRGFANYASC